MERLTIPDVIVDKKTTRRTIIDGSEVRKYAMEFYWRLKLVEDILGDDYDLDRLRKLVEEDRAGRCVVLPCEVGDSVWVTMAYGKQYNPPVHGHINKFVLHDDEIFYLEAIIWMDIGAGKRGYGYSENSFGKIVFLTPEAAEAALKGEPPC